MFSVFLYAANPQKSNATVIEHCYEASLRKGFHVLGLCSRIFLLLKEIHPVSQSSPGSEIPLWMIT